MRVKRDLIISPLVHPWLKRASDERGNERSPVY
jgi:hypothetical protein